MEKDKILYPLGSIGGTTNRLYNNPVSLPNTVVRSSSSTDIFIIFVTHHITKSSRFYSEEADQQSNHIYSVTDVLIIYVPTNLPSTTTPV